MGCTKGRRKAITGNSMLFGQGLSSFHRFKGTTLLLKSMGGESL